MNKTLGTKLLAYSVFLLALALLNHWVAGDLAKTAFVTGIAGTTVSTALGLAALCGAKGKTLPILALAVISFVLLSEVVHLLLPDTRLQGPHTHFAGFLALVMLFLSVAMLMMIAWSGTARLGNGHQQGPPKR